jgi:O-acetylserine/cysteine efflux transporter
LIRPYKDTLNAHPAALMTLTAADCFRGMLVAVIWGTGVVVVKSALTGFPPILLMFFRFALSALVLIWFVPIPYGSFRKIVILSILAGAVQYSLTFTGLKGLDASVTALLLQLEVPLLVLVGAVALGEKPGLRRCLGIALAFSGVAVMAEEPRLSGAYGSMLLVLGGALAWATGQALVRNLALEGRTITAWFAIFTAPQLFLASLLFETNQLGAIAQSGPSVLLVVVYLGLMMTVVGDSTWNGLVRRYPISTLAPFLLLQPVVSAIGAVVFLGEMITLRIAIGGGIVIAGVGAILRQHSQA